jgi:hypothetical protein
MFRSLLTIIAVAFLACAKPGGASAALAADGGRGAADAGPRGSEAPAARSPAVEACVDRWLAEHHLNEYGDPEGTVYAGGTPLFDETSGRQTDRLEHVFARHPEARARCLGEGADAGTRSR